jgi:hypothetical protein
LFKPGFFKSLTYLRSREPRGLSVRSLLVKGSVRVRYNIRPSISRFKLGIGMPILTTRILLRRLNYIVRPYIGKGI